MQTTSCQSFRAVSSRNGRRSHLHLLAFSLIALAPLHAFGQQQSVPPDQKPPGHVLGIIPNYKTTPLVGEYKPLSTKEKFGIATQDVFDRGTVVLAGLLAGASLIEKSDKSFGEGVEGYAHYAVTGYADLAIGNYMTEAIYPTLLHEDPRYFRRGSGTKWSRLRSAVGQIFWTRTDSGGHSFNFSEIAGNSTAVAISMAYYPGSRSASDAVSQLGLQVALDMAGNVIKEFWPNKDRKASPKPPQH